MTGQELATTTADLPATAAGRTGQPGRRRESADDDLTP